jgi:hypothetical protein
MAPAAAIHPPRPGAPLVGLARAAVRLRRGELHLGRTGGVRGRGDPVLKLGMPHMEGARDPGPAFLGRRPNGAPPGSRRRPSEPYFWSAASRGRRCVRWRNPNRIL